MIGIAIAAVMMAKTTVSHSTVSHSSVHASTPKPKTTVVKPKTTTKPKNNNLYHGVVYTPVPNYLNINGKTVYYTVCYDRGHHQVKCERNK